MTEVKQNFVERSASVTKHTDSSKSLNGQLGDLSNGAVFLGELKAVKGHRKDILLNAEPHAATAVGKSSANDLVNLFTRIKQFLNNSYDIQRERAT